jgi:uncharacterized protein (UPF0332 family)/predicted nucleotidyltransferase
MHHHVTVRLYPRKEEALRRFVHKLLESKVGGSIGRILLFGSAAKGEAREGSDIDLLVVATDSVEEVSRACAEAAFEVAVETGESVEPLVRCVDRVRHPQSYFLYRTLHSGQEVYRMEAEELRRREARNYLNLSLEYLEGAIRNRDAGHFRIAVDAAYNACELVVKALLLLKLPDLPGSHGGIVQRFGELYVVTGDIPRDVGRRIAQALEKRNDARYDPHAALGLEEAAEVIALGEHLREILEKRLQRPAGL